MDLIVVGIVLPWALVAFGCWLGYQLLRQNGRILLRLEALEQRLGQSGAAPVPQPRFAPGLPLGSAAPEFALPDLAGDRRALSDFRGRRLLLVFFNPGCGFCTRMAPDLAALPIDGSDGRPLPLVLSTGSVEENRRLVAEHGIHCPVLLQNEMEVASQYQAGGTPMGCMIDEEGKIASELAVGAEAVLVLVEPPGAGAAKGQKVYKGNRSLADSRIVRDGLPAGTPAPDFALPRLGGGTLSLEDFRGRRVLLVFSDPNCGPCNTLLPQLEPFSRDTAEVQIVMVSRGAVEANERKAAEYGVTFPVVLQRQWEISRLYGRFATPIAYLIDEAGVIAADVAVGVEAILGLAAGTGAGNETESVSTNGKAAARRPGEAVARRLE